MKYFALLFISLSLLSCSKTENKEQPFDSFVYSFTALRQDYMVKINNSDTLYFWKRFPKPETISYAIMEESQRDSIIALTSKIDFTKYKIDYAEENVVDAVGLRFDLVKAGKLKTINIYGGNAPEELYDHAAKFNEFIKHLNFQPYNGKVDFGIPIRPDVPSIPEKQ